MPEKVTIKTIAKDLGLSHMTVSRALSNHPHVHSKTRAAILKRASELGYVKSAAAAAMRGERTKIVGLLLPNIINEFYAAFANALEAHCSEAGMSLIMHLTGDQIDKEELALIRLQEVQAASVIMVPCPAPSNYRSRHLQQFKTLQFIRQRRESQPTSALLLDDASAITASINHLKQQGHSRIGYIGASRKLASGKKRYNAFRTAMDKCSLRLDETLAQTDNPSFDFGAEAARSLLQRAKQPSAILCGGFEISRGALDTLLQSGVRMPDDIAFVGYGDPDFYRWVGGGVTTLSLPLEDLANIAAQLVSDSKAEERQKRHLPARLTIRHTA